MATLNSFARNFNSKLKEPVRQHLRNVYACLAFSTAVAALGAYIHIYTQVLSAVLLSALGGLSLLILLLVTPYDGKNMQLRLGYLLGFAFCSGHGMGPLLDAVIEIDPSIIVEAFFCTCIIFVSFSLCAMFAERGRWLYLGGTLLSLFSTLFIFSVINVFVGSYYLFQADLYIGLALMCAFVLYDTQLMIEKRRNGDKDFVEHSLDLFIDFIGIFRRLVIILTQKEQKKRRRD